MESTRKGLMKAWKIPEHGPVSVLQLIEVPAPEPGPCEVRVRVEAVGLNHLDIWVRQGVAGHAYPLPLIPGCDVTGVCDRVGPGASGIKPGDPVIIAPGIGCGRCVECLSGRDPLCRWYGILGETRDGGCAEFVVVPVTHLVPRPPNLTIEEAAAVPLTLLTAWQMVVVRADVRPGETVLVHAAGSGVGVMAIQIAKLLGARVIATAGTPQKVDAALKLGADSVINYREVDFLDEVKRLTGKRGVDVVVEHVGLDTWERSVRALAKGGRLVTCGATTGANVSCDLRHVFFKSLSILGSTMGGRGELDRAIQFIESGRIRPIVDRAFAMEDLPAAHTYLEERHAFGKVVVRAFR
jgi:NADPH:quinone reductase-like Zn-dependent oxidoreductase